MNHLHYWRLLLLFASIFLGALPAPSAAAHSVVPSQQSSVIASQQPIQPRKKQLKKRKHKPLIQTKDIGGILVIAFPALMIIGGILFAVGVGIALFSLWLTGLLVFGIFNLFIITFLLSNKLHSKSDDGLGFAIFAILFLIMGAINLIFGLTFLIWGLIATTPLFWIVGIACLVLLIVCFIGMIVENFGT